MNGKWILGIGLPLVLVTAGLVVAGPMVYYDLRLDANQIDPNVVVINNYTATVNSQTVVSMNIIVWVREWNGDTSDNGLQKANFGAESSYGGLLGNTSWTVFRVPGLPPAVAKIWEQTGYLPGTAYDHDGDGATTDKDVGGLYMLPYNSIPYDANFADFPAASAGGTGYVLYDDWFGYYPGFLAAEVLGPDSNVYVGYQVGTLMFSVTSPSVPDLNTALKVYPFFYATAGYLPHKFKADGDSYNLNQPFDPNYVADPNLREFAYVSDPASYEVWRLEPVNIIGIPEPTVLCLTLVGAAALLSRRRRKA